jgi:hypothetical protein
VQKAHCLTICENEVFEIEGERLGGRLLDEQREQLTQIFGIEFTDHGEHDVTVSNPLYLEHWFLVYTLKDNYRSSTQVSESKYVAAENRWRALANDDMLHNERRVP